MPKGRETCCVWIVPWSFGVPLLVARCASSWPSGDVVPKDVNAAVATIKTKRTMDILKTGEQHPPILGSLLEFIFQRVTSWIYFSVDQGQALPNSDACLFCQHIELFYRDTRETLWFFIGVYSDEVDMLWPNTGDINWYSSPFIAIHFVSWGNKMMWTKVLWRSLSSKLSRTRRQPLKFAVGCSLLLLLRRRRPPPPPPPRPRPRPRRRPRRLLLRLLLLTN